MQPLKTMAECLDETARSIIDAKPMIVSRKLV